MAKNSDAFSETFIEGLRRDISRWKSELSLLDVGEENRGAYLQTSELKAWIEAGEAIFARYERRRAESPDTVKPDRSGLGYRGENGRLGTRRGPREQ